MRPNLRIAALIGGLAVLLFALAWMVGTSGSVAVAPRPAASPAIAQEEELPLPVVVDASPDEAPAPLQSGPGAGPEPEPESTPEPDRTEESAERGAYRFDLSVLARGAQDRPLQHALVALAPVAHPLNLAGTTAGDGRLHLEWRAHVPTMTVAVAVAGPGGTWSGLRRLSLESGKPHELDLVLPGELAFATEENGRGAMSRPRRRREPEQGVPDALLGAPAIALEGEAVTFAWSSSESSILRSLGRHSAEYEDMVELLEDIGWIRTDPDRTEPEEGPEGPVTGRVLDEFLRPAVGALVTVGPTRETPSHSATCDGEGVFRFQNLEPRIWQVWAGGGDRGVRRAELASDLGGSDWGELVLDRGRELEGEVVTTDGHPLVGWRVDVEQADRYTVRSDSTRTSSDGRFAIPNLEPTRARVLARPHDVRRVLPSVVETVSPSSSFMTITVAGSSASRLSIEVREPQPEGNGRIELRIWQESSGWGVLGIHTAGETFRTPPLPDGDYRIVAVSESSGASLGERVHVRRGAHLPRISIDLPGSGHLTIGGGRSTAKEREYSLWRLGEVVDSLVTRTENRVPAPLEVPAGDYLLEIVEDGSRLRSIPFIVVQGRETEIYVPDESSGADSKQEAIR